MRFVSRLRVYVPLLLSFRTTSLAFVFVFASLIPRFSPYPSRSSKIFPLLEFAGEKESGKAYEVVLLPRDFFHFVLDFRFRFLLIFRLVHAKSAFGPRSLFLSPFARSFVRSVARSSVRPTYSRMKTGKYLFPFASLCFAFETERNGLSPEFTRAFTNIISPVAFAQFCYRDTTIQTYR